MSRQGKVTKQNSRSLFFILASLILGQVPVIAGDSIAFTIHSISPYPMVSLTEFDDKLLLADNSGGLFVWSKSGKHLLDQKQLGLEIHLLP